MTFSQDKLNQDYNLIWDSYARNEDLKQTVALHLRNRPPYYEKIEKCISHFSHPKVIELGCGTGVDINIVYNQNRNIIPYASDLLFKSVQVGCRVRQLFHNEIKFFVSDTRHLPLKDKKVDIVFSQGLVEHFKRPSEVIKEQARILKKGGFLIVNVPQKFTGYTLMKKVKIRNGTWKLGWEKEFSYNHLKKLGNQTGLKEVSIGGYQYWKSWKEPAFVLKDLVDKIFRRIPLHRFKIFRRIQTIYNSLWHRLELKWGHYFMQNIIIVFEK